MQHIKIREGINFKQSGSPHQAVRNSVDFAESVQRVALCGEDFRNLQPELLVSVGDTVALGQPLFTDRNQPAITFTAPASGVIQRINIARRRTLGLIEIECSGNDQVTFTTPDNISDRTAIQNLLLKSGLWTAFRTRPFSQIPAPASVPSDIFVTAIDTEPLAADPRVVLQNDLPLFQSGLRAISSLTDGNTYVCQSPGAPLSGVPGGSILDVAFSGHHPAGIAGTHIHTLSPVDRHKRVWSISYQDVVAIGELFAQGTLRDTRIIALSGNGVIQPRLVRTRIGANLSELISRSSAGPVTAVFSGSALSGRQHAWLGRYHNQVTVMQSEPPLLAWFDFIRQWLEKHLAGNGAIVPECWLDSASPLTELTVPFLRALSIGDLESAEELGCLSFAIEDIAPLSRICTARHDFSALLNQCLDELHSTLSLEEG